LATAPVKRKRKAKPGRPRKKGKRTGELRRGAPSHVVTPKNIATVQMLAAARNSKAVIAKAIHISVGTLDKYYLKVMHGAPGAADARVISNFLKQATKDDFRSYPFARSWLAQFQGWAEKNRTELVGANGGPVEFRNLDALSDDELEALERITAKIAVNPATRDDSGGAGGEAGD